MTYRRTPHDQAIHVWSIDEQDTRVLRIGYGVVTVGVIVGACGVALMDTAFAAFGILIFLGLMIPCAAGVFVADHLANKPDEVGDTEDPTTSP
jgi:purine-cytosine permease-like protein